MRISPKKIGKVFLILIYSIFIFVLVFYIINIFKTFLEFPIRNWFLAFILCSLFLPIYFLMSKLHVKNEKLFIIALVILSLIFYVSWGISSPLKPVSDYMVLYNGAKEMLQGNFSMLSFNPQNYFYFYNFQIGYTTFLAGIMLIFNSNSLFLLHIIEILILISTNISLYFLIKKLFNKSIAMNSAFIYTIFLPNIMGSSIINNQHIALLFVIVSLLLLFNKEETTTPKNYFFVFLSGVFLSLGYIMRQSTIIIYLAIFIYYVIDLLLHKNKNIIKILLVLTFSFFISQKVIDMTIINMNIAPDSTLQAHTKYFKFWLGISKESTGIFNMQTTDAESTQVYYDLKELNFDYEKYNQLVKEKVIYEYTQNTKTISKNILNKMNNFVGGYDGQVWFSSYTDNQYLHKFVDQVFIPIGFIQYTLMIICSFILALDMLKNKKENPTMFFILVFLGIFFVHIFIEVQTRYRFEQYFCLSILSGIAIEKIIKSKLKAKKIII